MTSEAQIGSLKTGSSRLLEIVERRGEAEALNYAQQLIDYSARIMRQTLSTIPDGIYEVEDALDDDGIDDRPVVIHAHTDRWRSSCRSIFTGAPRKFPLSMP